MTHDNMRGRQIPLTKAALMNQRLEGEKKNNLAQIEETDREPS